MEDEYIDYISDELDLEIFRCQKIQKLLDAIVSFDETKKSVGAYLKAIKILFLIKDADVSIDLEKPELWQRTITNQLRESRLRIEELEAKLSSSMKLNK